MTEENKSQPPSDPSSHSGDVADALASLDALIRERDVPILLPGATLAPDAVDQLWNWLSEQEVLNNPIPTFRRSVKLLTKHSPQKQKPRVGVRRMRGKPIANAVSKRACIGYRIEVHPNLYALARDAVEFVLSRAQVVSRTHEPVVGPILTPTEFVAALKDSVTNYVKSKGAWPVSLRLEHSRIRRMKRQLVTPIERRTEGVGAAWLQCIVHFIVAHELAHIARGDCDQPYPASREERIAKELIADGIGTTVFFMPMISTVVFQSGLSFEHAISIPVCAFGAVAIVFTLFEITKRAADQLGIPWDEEYPSGSERYAMFRDVCIQQLNIAEEAFSKPISGLSPPDDIHSGFSSLAAQTSWAP